MNLQPNVQKEESWQDLNFLRGVAAKEGVDIFQFSQKNNQLKSKTFNGKKNL